MGAGEIGSASHKYLWIPSTPRQAALAGSGLADPNSALEASANPMAGAWSSRATLSGSQARLSERLGASWNSLETTQPWGPIRLLFGGNYLDVADLSGRDEFGNSSGEFAAFAWGLHTGLASDSGALTWGMRTSFHHYNIGEFDSRALLADASLGYALGQRIRFAAAAFHWGWVEEFATEEERAPFTLQVGVSARPPIPGVLAWQVHADLRRSTGAKAEFLVGLESSYQQALVLRLGTNASARDIRPSGGVALRLGGVEASYGYAAHAQLRGNHHFGLGYSF